MISGVAIYVFGLALVYGLMLIGSIFNYRGRAFLIWSLFLLGVIAVFRGSVGTDTAMYEAVIELSRSSDYSWAGREPGFVFLAEAFQFFSDSDLIVIRLFAAVFVFGLIFMASRSDRDEIFLLLALFIPVQFYDYSMNLIRIGLASILILNGMQFLRRGNSRCGLGLMFLSVFFHYSAIISVAYLLISSRMVIIRRLGLGVSLFFLLVVGLFFFFNDYFLSRLSAYAIYEPSSALSGLSDLLVLVFIILGGLLSSLHISSKIVFSLTTILFVGGAFFLSRYTVAGLRILDLMVFIVPVSLLVLHYRESKSLGFKVKALLLAAGIIGTIATLRNFLASAGQGRSPWVPYEFIF